MSARPNTNAAWFHPPWWPTNRGGSRPPQRSTKEPTARTGSAAAATDPRRCGVHSLRALTPGHSAFTAIGAAVQTWICRTRAAKAPAAPLASEFAGVDLPRKKTHSAVRGNSRPGLSGGSHPEPLTTYDDAATASEVSAALGARE